MTNASPPSPRTRIWTWAPWLAVLAVGVGVHGWMSARPAQVQVIPIPTPPTIVTVEAEPPPETNAAPVDTTASHDCDRKRRRRSERKRRRDRHESRPAFEADCHLDGTWVCTVDRQTMLAHLEHSSMPRMARLVPSQKDGQIVGLKIYGIRKGSLPEALHLQNGDLLVSIDGVPTNDLETLVEHISELQAELKRGSLSVDYTLVRKGVELTQTLRVE